MNRRSLLRAGLGLGVVATAVSGCSRTTYTVRYRIRVVVRVDGRLHEGSSVLETQWYDNGTNTISSERFTVATWGEAIVVDLDEKGLLFGLLEGPSTQTNNEKFFSAQGPDDVLLRVLPGFDRRKGRYGGEEMSRFQSIQGEFAMPHPPLLVRFLNINDPASAERVIPAAFASVYGSDAAFISATMSTTNDPITTGIEDRLPWLEQQRGALALGPDGTRGHRFAGQLVPSHFKIDGR